MKPILFNTDMVRAILEGRKTVTRRVVKFLPGFNPKWTGYVPDGAVLYGSNNIPAAKAPYRPGDILYVRETWRLVDFDYIDGKWSANVSYKADCGIGPRLRYLPHGSDERCGWRPSIHMPREAARIFLRVTDVRVERLQEITNEQAQAEGTEPFMMTADVDKPDEEKRWQEMLPALSMFPALWDRTIKKADRALYGWDANPWCWVIEFERCERPKGD